MLAIAHMIEAITPMHLPPAHSDFLGGQPNRPVGQNETRGVMTEATDLKPHPRGEESTFGTSSTIQKAATVVSQMITGMIDTIACQMLVSEAGRRTMGSETIEPLTGPKLGGDGLVVHLDEVALGKESVEMKVKAGTAEMMGGQGEIAKTRTAPRWPPREPGLLEMEAEVVGRVAGGLRRVRGLDRTAAAGRPQQHGGSVAGEEVL